MAMNFESKIEHMKRKLQSGMDQAQARMAKFAVEMAKPEAGRLQTMAWSKDIFEAAAIYDANNAVLFGLNDGATVESIREYLTVSALNLAKYPPQSTSPTSNLADQYKGAATMKILDDFKMFDY